MNPPIQKSQILSKLKLLPYQFDFAANDSRFKIGLWARQTGKDHTATAEAVIDCLEHPGTTWIILAASERQALESLAKAKDWADLLKFRIEEYTESPAGVARASGLPPAGVSPAGLPRLTSAEIKWSNGSRLIALPANPHTIRGYSANVILTEFAFHEDADAIWRAIYPSISNPLRGGLKKLRIISTPNGMTNKFADLWFNAPGTEIHRRDAEHAEKSGNGDFYASELSSGSSPSSGVPSNLCALSASAVNSAAYFRSKITIHDAIAGGLGGPCGEHPDAAELRAGLNDSDAWAQEYLCEFMDSSSVMFPYDLIAPCESTDATETGLLLTTNHSTTTGRNGELFAGIDFGRKHHLTVCWILEAVPASSNVEIRNSKLFVTREVLTLKNTSTPEQLEILCPRLRHCRKICLDYTGTGVGLGDYVVKEFGGDISAGASLHLGGAALARSQGKVELCQFTTALKAELFPRLRAPFEQRLLRIPISREIREDLHAIQRTVTQSGQITYRAPHSADGHSDRTTALALALRAATSAARISAPARTIWVPGRTADLRWAQRPRLPRWRRVCL